ncbi:MAG: ATP-dependent DNA helicase RecG [Phycisphaerales bacterium]
MSSRRTDQLTLLTPIDEIPGVNAKTAPLFRRLGVRCLAHLINHLPFRHEREEAESTIEKLEVGAVITTRGEITDTKLAGFGRKTRFMAALSDGTGTLELVFFNQTYLSRRLTPGTLLTVTGKLTQRDFVLQLVNPRWREIKDEDASPAHERARLRPIYPATEDLPSHVIERVVEGVLDQGLALLDDHLPEDYRLSRELPSLRDAYRWYHRPADEAQLDEARRRLVFDELLLLQLGIHMKRAHLRRTLTAPSLDVTDELHGRILARIPFTLTPGQKSVIGHIRTDLAKGTPANRLIQGDVGAGKTVVALYAMLAAVALKHQAVLMAPTELLAEQHFLSITGLLEGSRVSLELLTGSLTASEREGAVHRIARGESDIVIGTHALLTDDVKFKSLASVVIDEQHRFGVEQRAVLRDKSIDHRAMPHIFVMTATPIPRTLALTIFGDLDVSTITGLPPGRTPVHTAHVPSQHAESVYAKVREHLDAGEQAYIVLPAIDDASTGLTTVRERLAWLEQGPLNGKRIAALHGRLDRATRDHIMHRFRGGSIDALVATTVIEVGVDVPNATVMVIEHAERFGLAQLHQLRGRVGRGAKPSSCYLIADPNTEEGEARIRVMTSTNDGFRIAEKDLEIRGPGEILGSRQSGALPFVLTEFPRDTELLMLARRDAEAWIEKSPLLHGGAEALLLRRLLKAHGESLDLTDVA